MRPARAHSENLSSRGCLVSLNASVKTLERSGACQLCINRERC